MSSTDDPKSSSYKKSPSDRSPASNPSDLPAPPDRVKFLLGSMIFWMGAVFLGVVLAIRFYLRWLNFDLFSEACAFTVVFFSFVLMVYGRLAHRIPRGPSLAVLSISVTCVAVVCLFFYIAPNPSAVILGGFRMIGRMSHVLPTHRPMSKPLGIWQFDERYGYSPLPNSTGTHVTHDFKVTYTIGPDGYRITPSPKKPVGSVLITGCSFTFGYGVEDAECYSHLLGAEHWPDYKIINHSAMGWGTSHAYLASTDALSRKPLPSLVIYAFFNGHVMRNYLSKDWIQTITTHAVQFSDTGDPNLDRRGHPHFEIENDRPVWKRVIEVDQGMEDSPALRQKERDLTVALIRQMHRDCQAKGVPFTVVCLPEKSKSELRDEVKAVLLEEKIPYLDLTDLNLASFTNDHHPNADDHRWLARVIAMSFISDYLQGPAPKPDPSP